MQIASTAAGRTGYFPIFASGRAMTRPVQPQRNGPAHDQDAAGNRADACRRAHRRPEPFGSCPANLSRAPLRVSSAANGTITEDRNGHGKANKMTPAYDWAALPTKPRRHRRTKASRQANSRLRIFTCAHIAYYLWYPMHEAARRNGIFCKFHKNQHPQVEIADHNS